MTPSTLNSLAELLASLLAFDAPSHAVVRAYMAATGVCDPYAAERAVWAFWAAEGRYI